MAAGERGPQGEKGERGGRGPLRPELSLVYGVALTILAVGLVVIALQVRAQSHRSAQRAMEAAQTARVVKFALCTFVGDLQGRADDQRLRVVRSERFLRDNPRGIPGISASLLRQGIRSDKVTLKNQRATIRSFVVLDC